MRRMAHNIPFTVALCFALVLPNSRAMANDAERAAREGVAHYSKQNYEKAAESFQKAAELDPASAAIQYDLGTALVQKGEFDKAAEALKRSIEYPGTPSPAASHYNLGYSRVKGTLVAPQESGDVRDKIRGLQAGLEDFRQAIIADPKDLEAKHNFEVTRELIRRLEQQMPQQQQEEQSEQNSDQEQQESEQNEQQDQQQNEQQEQQSEQNQQQEQQDQQDQENQEQNQEQQEQPSEQQQSDEQQQDESEQSETTQESGLEATPTPGPPPPSQEPSDQEGETEPEQEQPLTPEQLDALRVLNSLEEDKPEQFKKVFRFQGRATGTRLRKDW